MEKFSFLPKDKVSLLPKTTGIYAFKNRELLYIGKASNIKQRVKSHFNLASYRDSLFMDKVEEVGYLETESEIEALVMEAEAIKKYQPKYNVLWKDDKNYFFVKIDKEGLPYVKITHQPVEKKKTKYIGPFIEGESLKKSLKALRRIFPYYTSPKHPKKPCSFCRLGLCPGPEPDLKEYGKNIVNLKNFLLGKKKSVVRNMKKEMEKASQKENYEKAARIRDRISALEKVLAQTRAIKPKKEVAWKIIKKELENIFQKNIEKIEAYDVSNIQGQKATGSAVAFLKGVPQKDLYRKFRIKISGKPNDTAMIKEVVKRRFSHKEWPYPDLILVDGGKGQLGAVLSEIEDIPVAALAKKENKLFLKGRLLYLKDLPSELSNLFLYLRDEAHRFAISYHKKLRKREFIN